MTTHLLSNVDTIYNVPEFDDPDKRVVYDITVERWPRDDEAYIYVGQRLDADHPTPYDPVMRLDLTSAEALVGCLQAAIEDIREQQGIALESIG